jgi:hypothetical protein
LLIFSPKEVKFIKSHARGFGYWLWKPKIISQAFIDFPELDYILYLDAGCELNINPESRKTFQKYCEILVNNQYLAFPMGLPENEWTKRDLLDYLEVSKVDAESEQIMSGVFFIGRTFSEEFCSAWFRIMTVKNFSLLDDSPSANAEIPIFKEHRHDQSILSLLLKKQEIKSFIYDEQFHFPPNWNSADQYPIWTTRNRTRIKLHDMTSSGRFWRFIDEMSSKVKKLNNTVKRSL